MSDDITHSTGPRGPRIVERPAVPRMLDQLPVLPPRDLDHEVAPHVPPPPRTSGEQIADKSLDILDQATTAVLGTLQKLKDQIGELEQVVLNSQVTVRDVVRAHMLISEQAMQSVQQIGKQIVEAAQTLATRSNGK